MLLFNIELIFEFYYLFNFFIFIPQKNKFKKLIKYKISTNFNKYYKSYKLKNLYIYSIYSLISLKYLFKSLNFVVFDILSLQFNLFQISNNIENQDDLDLSNSASNLTDISDEVSDDEEQQLIGQYEILFQDNRLDEIFTSQEFLNKFKPEIKEELPDYNEYMKQQEQIYQQLSFNTGGCKSEWEKLKNKNPEISEEKFLNQIQKFVIRILFEETEFQKEVKQRVYDQKFQFFIPILSVNERINQSLLDSIDLYIQNLQDYIESLENVSEDLVNYEGYDKLEQSIQQVKQQLQNFKNQSENIQNINQISQQLSNYQYQEQFESIINQIYQIVINQQEEIHLKSLSLFQKGDDNIEEKVKIKLNIEECDKEQNLADKQKEYRRQLYRYIQYQSIRNQCFENLKIIISNLLNGQEIQSQLHLMQVFTQIIQYQNKNYIYSLQFGENNFIEIILIEIQNQIQNIIKKLNFLAQHIDSQSYNMIQSEDLEILFDDFIYNERRAKQFINKIKDNYYNGKYFLQQILKDTAQYLCESTISIEIDDFKQVKLQNYDFKIMNETNSGYYDLTNSQIFNLTPNNKTYNLQNSLAQVMFIKNQPIIYNWNQIARGVHRINWILFQCLKGNILDEQQVKINGPNDQDYSQEYQETSMQVQQNLFKQAQKFLQFNYYQQVKQFLSVSPCNIDLRNSFTIDESDQYYKELSLAINNFNTCVVSVNQIYENRYSTMFVIMDKQGKYRAHLVLDDYQNPLFNPLSNEVFRTWYYSQMDVSKGSQDRRYFEQQYRSALLSLQTGSSKEIQRILSEARLQDFLVGHAVANVVILHNGEEISNKLIQNIKQTLDFLNKDIDREIYDSDGKLKNMRYFCDNINIYQQYKKDTINPTLIPNFIFKQQMLAPFIKEIQYQELHSNIPNQMAKIYSVNKYDCYNYNIDKRVYTENIDIEFLLKQNIDNIKRILCEYNTQNIDLTTTIDEENDIVQIKEFKKLKTESNKNQYEIESDREEQLIQILLWAGRYYYHPIEVIACFTEGGRNTRRLLKIKGLKSINLINTNNQENQYQKSFQSSYKMDEMLHNILQSQTTMKLIDNAIRFQVMRKTIDLNSCFLNTWYIYQYLYLPNINAQKLNQILTLLQQQVLQLSVETQNRRYNENNQKYLQYLQQIKQKFEDKENINILTAPQFKYQQQEQNLLKYNILLKQEEDPNQDQPHYLTIFTSKEQIANILFTLLVQNKIYDNLAQQDKIFDQQLQQMIDNCEVSKKIQYRTLLVTQLENSQKLSFDECFKQLSEEDINQIIQQTENLYGSIQIHTIISTEIMSQLPIYSGFVPLERRALLKNENSSCIYTCAAMYRCYDQFALEKYKIFQNMEERDNVIDTKYFKQMLDYNNFLNSQNDYQCCNIVAVRALNGRNIIQEEDEESNSDEEFQTHKTKQKDNKQKQLEPLQDVVNGSPIQRIQWYDSLPINLTQAKLIMIIFILINKYNVDDNTRNIIVQYETYINQKHNDNNQENLQQLMRGVLGKDIENILYIVDQQEQILSQEQIFKKMKQYIQQQKDENIVKYLQSSSLFEYYIQQYYSDRQPQEKHDSINKTQNSSQDFDDQDDERNQGLIIQISQLFQDFYNPIQQFDLLLQYKIKQIDFSKLIKIKEDINKLIDNKEHTFQQFIEAVCTTLQNYQQYQNSNVSEIVGDLTQNISVPFDDNDDVIIQDKGLGDIIEISIDIVKQFKQGINCINTQLNFIRLDKNDDQQGIQKILDQLQMLSQSQLHLFAPIQVRLQNKKASSFKALDDRNIEDYKYIQVILTQNDSIQALLRAYGLNDFVNVLYPFTSFISEIYMDDQKPQILLVNQFREKINDKDEWKSIGDNYGRVLSLQFSSLLLDYVLSTIMTKQIVNMNQIEELINQQYNESNFSYNQFFSQNEIQNVRNERKNENEYLIDQKLCQQINIPLIVSKLLDKSQYNMIRRFNDQKQKQEMLEQFFIITNIQLQQIDNIPEQSQIYLSQLQSQFQLSQTQYQSNMSDSYFQFFNDYFINPIVYYNEYNTLLSPQLNQNASKQLMAQKVIKEFIRSSNDPRFKPYIYQNQPNQILQELKMNRNQKVIFIPINNNYNRIYACFLSQQEDQQQNQIVFLPLRELNKSNPQDQEVSQDLELMYSDMFELNTQKELKNPQFKSFDEVEVYVQQLRDFFPKSSKIKILNKEIKQNQENKFFYFICENARDNCYKYIWKRHEGGRVYKQEFYIVQGGIIFRNAYVQCKTLEEFQRAAEQGKYQDFQFDQKTNSYFKTNVKDWFI